MATAERETKLYEFEVKRRRVKVGGGYEPFWKTKKVAEALKTELEPLRVLGILRRDIPALLFQATRAQLTHHSLSPREVILSSYLLEIK